MTGFRIARVFGFEIRLDPSWFVIFFLILWSFTTGFPASVPGLSQWAYALMGLAGALLFFVSLLLHELAHAVVARAKDVPVAGITLFLFGGMAHTTREADSPGDEFLIAGAGPVASFAIAAALWSLFVYGNGAGWSDAVLLVGGYLAYLNLALAVFNLLPGFPLDGGRLLRAGVWKATGDLTRATRVASAAGRLIGYGLIGLGIWIALRGGFLSGAWLAFIGWFLRNAAVATMRQRLAQDVLDGVRAREAMTAAPAPVPADLPLDDLVEAFVVRQQSAVLPVERHGDIVGMVSLLQIKKVPREQWPVTRAADVMLPADEQSVVAPDDALTEVMGKLRGSPLRRVLVVDGGRLAGLLSISDVAAFFQSAQRREA